MQKRKHGRGEEKGMRGKRISWVEPGWSHLHSFLKAESV